MNSTQPDEPLRQLGLWAEPAEQPQNVQLDTLVEACIEKSALDENQPLIEEVVDEVIRRQLLDGSYRPSRAGHCTIEKPDGDTREPGKPNWLDRVTQTAVVLV